MPSGAPPEINSRARPPNASRSFVYTSLFASFQNGDPGSLPAITILRFRLPTPSAQLKIAFFSPCGFDSVPCRIFSNTRGTARKIVGFTAFIAPTRSSNFGR